MAIVTTLPAIAKPNKQAMSSSQLGGKRYRHGDGLMRGMKTAHRVPMQDEKRNATPSASTAWRQGVPTPTPVKATATKTAATTFAAAILRMYRVLGLTVLICGSRSI